MSSLRPPGASEYKEYVILVMECRIPKASKKKGRGYDPVTSADKAFEKFIRQEISKKFPTHQIRGEEFGQKKTKSDFTWIIDPIDGTRSFVIGNPTWSNLISLPKHSIPIAV